MLNFNAHTGARRLVQVCGRLKANETVAIVTDSHKVELAALIAGQVAALGAEPTVLTMSPRSVDGEEPTSLISHAMRHADLVVEAATYSLAHTEATRIALEQGARVVSVTDITEELLSTGGLYADFEAIRPICQALAATFTDAEEVHATAPGGTDIIVSSKGRQGNSHHCIVDAPGMFTAVPNIEANFAPVEASAQGQIVFDASIPNFRIGVLTEPVILKVRDGKIVDVSGDRQAKLLARLWTDQQDDSVYNIAQVAVGLNPKCRTVTGQLTNDHGVLGTMHFGIGTSRNLGGEVQASMHVDGILWSPTITVDGQTIMRDGKPIGDWAAGLVELVD